MIVIIQEIINNPKWKYELQTISHRLYSKGFFFGKTSQEDQNYDTNISYSQTYQLVANVMEKVSDNKYKIYIRNKLDTSKELELIRPKSDPIKFYVKNFLNTKK